MVTADMTEDMLRPSRMPVHMDREQRRQVLEKAERLIGLRKIKDITSKAQMDRLRAANIGNGMNHGDISRIEENYDDRISNGSDIMGTLDEDHYYPSEQDAQMDSDQDRYENDRDFDQESGSYVLDPLPSQQLHYLNHKRQNFGMDDDISVNSRKQPQKRGKLVTFYRNGDPHFKGLPVSVSSKDFASFETLLIFLNGKISTAAGVRHILTLPEGKEIKDINEFSTGDSYVVSSVKKLNRNVIYGNSRETHWVNKNFSAGKFRKGEQKLLKKTETPSKSSQNHITSSPQAPNTRVLEIISNTNRNSVERVILYAKTTQTFEEILSDISGMIVLQHPPVTALYTAKPPFRRVESFSQLTNDFYDHFEFLACGREGRPLELVSKREVPPDTNSSTDSRYSHHSTKTHTPRSLQQASPSRTTGFSNSGPGIRQLGPGQAKREHRARVPRKIQRYEPLDIDNSPSPQQLPSDRYVVPDGRPALKPKPRRSPVQEEVGEVKVDIHGHTRVFYPPRHPVQENGKAPDKTLKLDWVYGYRGRDARKNVYVLPSGELLYYVASVAIMLDRRHNKQRHYQGHTEDITCMALHPNRLQPYNYVATGQLAGSTDAHIRIWNSRSLDTYAVLGAGVFQNSISSLSFSKENDGYYLLAVDEGAKHMLSVWDWQNERSVAKTTTSVDTVVWANFHPKDSTIIITYGKEHIYFWKLFWDSRRPYAGRLLRDKHSGNFVDEVPKFVTALEFSQDGDVITGDSSGRIIVWGRNNNDAFVVNRQYSDSMRHAHTKSVFSLCMLEDGTLLSGGGNEIRAWDSFNRYSPVKQRMIPDTVGSIRTLIPKRAGGADGGLYVGTTRNILLEGSLQERFRFVVQGHSEELWGLAAHQEEHAFFTAGYDQQVCRWDAATHALQWRVNVEKPCLSVAVDPRGKLVVVGTTVGRFIVLNAYNGMHITSIQVGTEQLDAFKFSPDGRLLAMGSHDCGVYVFEVLDKGQVFRKHRIGSLKGHNNFITHLDWSSDSCYLRTVSGDYDILYWNIDQMELITDGKRMRDIDWHSRSCILEYGLLGAWSHLYDGEDINCVATSHSNAYVAVGENQGTIKFYRYPCATYKPKYNEVKNYTSHVTKAQFLFDDSFLISTGGVDAAVMQWSLVEAPHSS